MRLHLVLPAFLALLGRPAGLTAQQAAAPALPDTTAAVVSWVRQHAVPLRHLEAGRGFADLQPLKRVWKDVRVVGLGEITHGTREFFQVKHRLLEFLVREMGFTAFVIEASHSNSQPINDYVLHGRGDRASVLTGQGWIVWDTEEFAALLDWMRAYNASVPDERKVRFHGMDVLWNEVGQARVLAYLRRVAPEQVPAADSVFRVLAREEAKRPVMDTAAVAAVRPRLRRLEDYLGERRDTLVSRSSASEYATALQHVRVMQRAITPGARTAAMADNLKFIVEHERPGTKFVVWAYDTHLAKDTARTVGRYAREAFGEQYYAVGTAFYRGAYQTRVMRPNQPAGDLQAVVAPPAPAKSLPWSLFRARVGNLFLDLRGAAADPVARAWVGTPLVTQGSSWATQNPLGRHRTIRFGEQFDGIIFIETTTPTRPTPNARKNVANRVRI